MVIEYPHNKNKKSRHGGYEGNLFNATSRQYRISPTLTVTSPIMQSEWNKYRIWESDKMKKVDMTLMELQDIFGKRIRSALSSDEKTKEEREIEYEQTRLILDLGKQMINNADIVMRREALLAKTNNLSASKIDTLIGELEEE